MGYSVSTTTLWPCFETFVFCRVKNYRLSKHSQAPHATIPDKDGKPVHADEFMATDERFKNLNMTKFYADTVPDIYLPFCEYHRESCNRNNEWKFKFTFYGYCLEFNNDTTEEPLKVRKFGTRRILAPRKKPFFDHTLRKYPLVDKQA